MDYRRSTEECSDFDITHDFRDGHAYFVNVKVRTITTLNIFAWDLSWL